MSGSYIGSDDDVNAIDVEDVVFFKWKTKDHNGVYYGTITQKDDNLKKYKILTYIYAKKPGKRSWYKKTHPLEIDFLDIIRHKPKLDYDIGEDVLFMNPSDPSEPPMIGTVAAVTKDEKSYQFSYRINARDGVTYQINAPNVINKSIVGDDGFQLDFMKSIKRSEIADEEEKKSKGKSVFGSVADTVGDLYRTITQQTKSPNQSEDEEDEFERPTDPQLVETTNSVIIELQQQLTFRNDKIVRLGNLLTEKNRQYTTEINAVKTENINLINMLDTLRIEIKKLQELNTNAITRIQSLQAENIDIKNMKKHVTPAKTTHVEPEPEHKHASPSPIANNAKDTHYEMNNVCVLMLCKLIQ
jgi:hypothetical protein